MMQDAGNPIPPVEQFLSKSRHFLASGRYDLAVDTLREGLAFHPDNADLHGMIAINEVNRDSFDAARKAAHEALRLDPESLEAMFVLARCDIEQDIFSRAEKNLLDGLRIDPQSPDFLIEYARLMMITEHLRKAQGLVEAALVVDPENSNAISLRGLILAQRAVLKDSDEDKAKSLAIEPDSALMHVRAGSASLQAGRPFRARRHFREALRLDPSQPGIEEAFLEADRYCRWIGLPYYYWGLLVNRLPGKQFTIYAAVLLGAGALGQLGGDNLGGSVFFFYLGFVVYTWVANPLMNLWTKWSPPK